MTTCTVCGRALKSPRWFQGKPYGSVHYSDVAGAALRRARRRRIVDMTARAPQVDARQLTLQLEGAC